MDASGNEISALHPDLGQLKRLRTLQLDNNRLEAIPSEVLVGCTGLQTLSLHGAEARGERECEAAGACSLWGKLLWRWNVVRISRAAVASRGREPDQEGDAHECAGMGGDGGAFARQAREARGGRGAPGLPGARRRVRARVFLSLVCF